MIPSKILEEEDILEDLVIDGWIIIKLFYMRRVEGRGVLLRARRWPGTSMRWPSAVLLLLFTRRRKQDLAFETR